jgi:hypothetical protein
MFVKSTTANNCHPQRSTTVNEANRRAQSKDLYSSAAQASSTRFLCEFGVRGDNALRGELRGRKLGSFDSASSSERAPLRMTLQANNCGNEAQD